MKIIRANKITGVIAELCIQANQILRKDVFLALKVAYKKETNKRAKDILEAIIKNAKIAADEKLAICQDTGLVCVFVEIGQDVKINGDLKSAINKGVELGYKKGFLRNSVVRDPLLRRHPGYRPVIIHTDIVKGSRLKITVLPKGFGCENKSRLKMFNPTAKITEIKEFIVDAVKSAGPDACPPYIVGVGIGGTADYAAFLAKKALFHKINRQTGKPEGSGLPSDRQSHKQANRQTNRLEKELLLEINKLNIGPMGLGGKTTALAVTIETYPTHIAGLPVAVNISCHALRNAIKIL